MAPPIRHLCAKLVCVSEPVKEEAIHPIRTLLRTDYLPFEEVVEFLDNRPEDLHVIVTGRNAKPELIEAGDLVTGMAQIKHPFREKGVKTQKGVEF